MDISLPWDGNSKGKAVGASSAPTALQRRVGRNPLQTRTSAIVARILVLLLCFVLFMHFAFDGRYAPDYDVQVGYLRHGERVDQEVLGSLLNNTVVLDYVVPGVQRVTGLDWDTLLRACYIVVFALKYILVCRLFRSLSHVVMLFLWTFVSLDLNQLRLNLALMIFLVMIRLRRPILLGLAMIMTHFASAFVWPIAVIDALTKKNWRLFVFVGLTFLVAAAYAVSHLEFEVDERFLYYLGAPGEAFFPRALMAAPVVVIALHGTFDRWTRWLFMGLVALSIGTAAVGLSIVAARLIEMTYTAFILRVGVDGLRLSKGRLALMGVPAVLMFASRMLLGVNPSQ